MMEQQQEEDTGKLVVMNEDLTMGREHPHCFHGPTVLFYKSFQAPMDGFYACSAYRDRKLCDYYKLARYFTHSTLAKEPSLIYAQEILAKRNHVSSECLRFSPSSCCCCFSISNNGQHYYIVVEHGHGQK